VDPDLNLESMDVNHVGAVGLTVCWGRVRGVKEKVPGGVGITSACVWSVLDTGCITGSGSTVGLSIGECMSVVKESSEALGGGAEDMVDVEESLTLAVCGRT
jgi:hypothetical protein